MSTTLRKMDTQLKSWLARIEDMAARTPPPDATAEALTSRRVTELRALHATALTEFTGFRAARDEERAALKPRTVVAWNALAAALKRPKPAV
ncbi:MAG: hypothetical protein IPG61_06150 [bacterium]|nr:hypothetical protein [bacterium]MBK7670340.1 hypothetical protein [bacterium]